MEIKGIDFNEKEKAITQGGVTLIITQEDILYQLAHIQMYTFGELHADIQRIIDKLNANKPI